MPCSYNSTVYMLGLLKTYCDLRVAPQQASMWVSRMAVRVNSGIAQVLQELAESKFMMLGLKSIPEEYMASLFFAALNGCKVA